MGLGAFKSACTLPRMDSSQHTMPMRQASRLPVTTLKLTVVSGPSRGLSHVTDEDRVSIGSATTNDIVLDDPTVSRFHLQLVSTRRGVELIDSGSTNGTLVNGIRIVRGEVPLGTVLELGDSQVRIEVGSEKEVELLEGDTLGGLRARSPQMKRLLAQVVKAAKSDVPALLIGESGTGKELIARALHEQGPRAKMPFETVDCASLSPTLVASELFGHERGAFTGAERKHIGAFERANGGTLFLDEIGELPEQLQPMLLGALERRRFRRLGGREEVQVDVRVVSATHRDLKAEVNAQRFRLDLYYRIAVVRLEVPPLRDRLDDLPVLVEHFAAEYGRGENVSKLITPAFIESLRRHTWPGNVRELRNVVDATIAMGEAPQLDHSMGSIPPPSSQPAALGPTISLLDVLSKPYKDARGAVLHEFEVAYLTGLLERASGNVSQAAREADMDRSHLWELLRRHGLR